MNKQEIRRLIRRLKEELGGAERDRLTAGALKHLRELPAWRGAQVVLLYSSLPDEVCTHELIREVCAEGKRVLLPVVVGDELELRTYAGEDSMAKGAFNIDEPQGEDFEAYELIDLAVVPGIAFTPEGLRLGRGRGYYDRLLPRLGAALKVGLCWPFQLLAELPHEPHDVCMDLVIC